MQREELKVLTGEVAFPLHQHDMPPGFCFHNATPLSLLAVPVPASTPTDIFTPINAQHLYLSLGKALFYTLLEQPVVIFHWLIPSLLVLLVRREPSPLVQLRPFDMQTVPD